MFSRVDPYKAAPELMNAMLAFEAAVVGSGLDRGLIELVKTRASQINGCAFCLHMHTRDARAHGETEMRLYLLDAWRESPLYTDRERAALAWTEALTLVAGSHVPDAVYEEVSRQFDPAGLTRLTVLVGLINAWNRVSISLRAVHPAEAKQAA